MTELAPLVLVALSSPALAGEPSARLVAQEAYLKASNWDPSDSFGRSMAMDGDTLVIGASGEASAATGVGGNPDDDSLPYSGAVYVLVPQGDAWVEQAYVKASNPGGEDNFGYSVAIDGDTLVVGALREAGGSAGVDGDQQDDSLVEAGAAYVFVRQGTSWSQQAYLKASNPDAGDRFGHAVAVSGDTVVVGAPREASAATGVDGDQQDDSTMWAGAAYVFVRQGTSWSQQAYLKASNTGTLDNFGQAVALEGDLLVVGAGGEGSSATGVDGDQGNEGAPGAGAVYAFARSGSTWTQEAYLKASNTDGGDRFGFSLALEGDRLLVGATGERGGATGVNGDQEDDSIDMAGAVYVFERGPWSQQAYVKASHVVWQDQFGHALALSGDRFAVGVPEDDNSAHGVNVPYDWGYPRSGAVFLFELDGGSWSETHYVKTTNALDFALFGHALALEGDVLVGGAPGERNATLTPSGQVVADAAGSGSAYVFDLDAAAAGSGFCEATSSDCPCANGGLAGRGCDNAQATGGTFIEAIGTPAVNDVVLYGKGFPISTLPATIAIRSPLAEASPVVFGDGVRCVSPSGLVRLGATVAWGGLTVQPLSHGAGPGTFFYQLWYRNTPSTYCTPAAFNVSSGVSIVWP